MSSILTRWRNRPIGPRRARAIYEAQRLRFLIEDLDRENARRERERNRPCPWCAAVEDVPMPTGRPEGERFTEDGEVRVSLGGGKSIPVKDAADYFRYINGEVTRGTATGTASSSPTTSSGGCASGPERPRRYAARSSTR